MHREPAYLVVTNIATHHNKQTPQVAGEEEMGEEGKRRRSMGRGSRGEKGIERRGRGKRKGRSYTGRAREAIEEEGGGGGKQRARDWTVSEQPESTLTLY